MFGLGQQKTQKTSVWNIPHVIRLIVKPVFYSTNCILVVQLQNENLASRQAGMFEKTRPWTVM